MIMGVSHQIGSSIGGIVLARTAIEIKINKLNQVYKDNKLSKREIDSCLKTQKKIWLSFKRVILK